MTTSNVAADMATKTGTEKVHEKLAEKRRALGRGLESLLPGPRAVVPALPQTARKDGAPASSGVEGGRPGAAVVPPEMGTVTELQAAAAGQAAEGELAFELALDLIDQNPHQTRQEFDAMALGDLAGSIQAQGVLQPIVVRPGAVRAGASHPEGAQRYTLILGERRYRASKMAGKTTIPVIVK